MKKQLRRVLVLLLAFTMCFGSAVTLFAADAEVTCPGTGKVHTKDNCKYTEESVVAPNCETDGYTIYHCDVCGDHFIDDLVDEVGEHVWEVQAEKAPICGDTGVLAHEKCKVCEKVRLNGFIQGKGDNVGDDQIMVKVETKNSEGKVTEVTYKVMSVKDALEIDAAGKHNWSAWTEKDNAEGTAEATKTWMERSCQTEGCKAVETCGEVETEKEEGDKKYYVHAYEVVKIVTEPDNVNKKYGIAIEKCTICGTVKEDVKINYEHKCADEAEFHKKQNADCKNIGYAIDCYECTVCDKWYSDKACEKELDEEKVKIPMHPTATKNVNEATCTGDGSIIYTCPVCNEVVTERTEYTSKPLGHVELTYGDLTGGKDVWYKKEGESFEFKTNEENVDDGYVLIHKASDVVVDYRMKDVDTNYDPETIKDTDSIFTIKYCTRGSDQSHKTTTDDENAQVEFAATEITIVDESGVEVKITLGEAMSAWKMVTETKGKGHTYTKGTVAANCTHGKLTYYYCENENCSLEAVYSVTGKYTTDSKASDRTYLVVDEYGNGRKVCGGTAEDHPYSDDNKTASTNHTANTLTGDNITASTCTAAASAQEVKCGCQSPENWTGEGYFKKAAHEYSYKAFDGTEAKKPNCQDGGYMLCSKCGAKYIKSALEPTKVEKVLTYAEHTEIVKEHKTVTEKEATCKTKYATATCEDCKMTWQFVPEGGVVEHEDSGSYTGTDDKGNKEAAAVPEHFKYITTEKTTINGNEYAKDKEVSYEDAINAGLAGKTETELKSLQVKKGDRVAAVTAAFFCKTCSEFIKSTTGEFGGHTIEKRTVGSESVPVVYEAEETPEHGSEKGNAGYRTKDSYYCTVCKDYVDENGKTVVEYNKHTLKDSVKAVSATCEADGNEAYFTCKDCDKKFSDKELKTEITKDVVTLATGHSYDSEDKTAIVKENKDGDCTTADYTLAVCKNCGKHVVFGYVAAKAHDLKAEKAKAATCTEDGYTAYKKCSVEGCGYEEGKDVVPATGHKDKDGNVFYACNQKGKICQNANCDTSVNKDGKNEKTVANRVAFKENEAHSDENQGEKVNVPATCTTDGVTYNKCKICGKILKTTEVTKALGHEMVYSKTLVNATEVSEGKDLYVCAHTWLPEGETAEDKKVKCTETEERVTPKLSDLKLNISVDNAVVAGAEIVESGKVKVTISISSRDSAIWGTNFSVTYDPIMLSFVGFENASEGLFTMKANALTTSKEEEVNDEKVTVTTEIGEVKVVAYAEDNAETHKSENVKISGEVKLIDLYFNVVGDTKTTNGNDGEKKENKTTNITISEAHGSTVDAESVTVAVADEGKEGIVTVKPIADIDGTGYVDINDLSKLLGLKNYREYNAAADLNKDGSVDQRDFDLLYNYLSGAVIWDEIVVTLKAAE